MFGIGKKVVSTVKGRQTETKTYEKGTLTKIQHTDNPTGKTHEHKVCRGGALGLFGPWQGPKK